MKERRLAWTTAKKSELAMELAGLRAEVEEARKGTLPPPASLYEDIFLAEVPDYIRGAEHPASIRHALEHGGRDDKGTPLHFDQEGIESILA
jgi:hypothetical protein